MRPGARLIAASSLLALALSAGSAVAHPSSHVIANGGRAVEGSGRIVRGTLGQAMVGRSDGTANLLAHGYWATAGARVTSVYPTGGAGIPAAVAFGPAEPNPSRDLVRFAVNLPRASRVELTVYDVAGREVDRPAGQEFAAGVHRLEWRRPAGRTGVCFARLLVNGRSAGVRRIVLVE